MLTYKNTLKNYGFPKANVKKTLTLSRIIKISDYNEAE